MLTYSFDNISVSLYEHLYKCIRDDILSGELPADTRLPSKRAFAKNLNVSTITVENAYGQLMSEGFIYSKPRSGFFVSNVMDSDFFADNTSYRSQAIHNKRNAHTDTVKESDNDILIDFASNATDSKSFPFQTWAKVTRRILSEEQELLMKNSPSNGIAELRQAISEYLLEFRGISASPQNIIIGAGTEYLYTILIQLLGSDRIYATENPGYRKLSLILDMIHLSHRDISLDKDGVSIEELYGSKADVVHVTPSHHFPTGITMPIRRRYELLRWAMEKDAYIIEDDYDSEFRLAGRPIPALYSIDSQGHVIYMNTFTKSLASTIRISYMVLPDTLAEEYHARFSFYSCTVSTFEQKTLADFISLGYYEKHINRMRTSYRKKRDLLLSAIKKSPLSSISEIREANAGLHFVIKFNTSMEDTEITSHLRRIGINLLPLSFFGDGEEHAFLINYSSVPSEMINYSIDKIISIFE